jgi:2-oxoglutarate ferredoxin oxidoreductase subunit delta
MAKIKIKKERCKGCCLCIVNCPNNLIKVSRELGPKGVKPVYFSGGKCTSCAMCAVICPDLAIEVFK